jgi:hypothetical protein
MEWRGAQEQIKSLCHELGNEKLLERIPPWASDNRIA